MMTFEQFIEQYQMKQKIQNWVKEGVQQASEIWDQAESYIMNERAYSKRAEYIPTLLREIPFVSPTQPVLKEYIAVAIDMRNSTQTILSPMDDGVKNNLFQTYAFLPTVANIIAKFGGSITEFLGDGILGFFDVDSLQGDLFTCMVEVDKWTKFAYQFSNEQLQKNDIKQFQYGMGLSIGKAIVTTFINRIDNETVYHPKVISGCVYEASKLSRGCNITLVSQSLHRSWPRCEGGNVTFKCPQNDVGVPAYQLSYIQK